MGNLYLEEIKKLYEDQLLTAIVPFWIKNSLDKEYGGYMTWVDFDGSLLSTDKAVWMQGRGLFIYSRLYNEFKKNEDWLSMAESGYKFLKNYCIDTDQRLFFRMTRDGKPIIKRRYVFSDVFAAAGFMEYYRATGVKEAYHLSLQCFKTVYDVFYGNLSLSPKTIGNTWNFKNHSLVMIMIDLCKTMRLADTSYDYDKIISDSIFQIKNHFYNQEKKCLLENVGLHGEYEKDIPEGRLLNPGHAIETAWFILDEALQKNSEKDISFALELFDNSLALGWDKKYGGIFAFLDSENKPPLNLEWDMKLWWPHNEALIASLLAYQATKDDKYLKIHKQLNDYCMKYFLDLENGEWYGYLHRDNTPSTSVKGCIWKGPFHVPRFYMYSLKIIENLLK
ncbi:MAG: AGE family epimerase/isomerase [Clostridia bacterium]|nr:AGE family epimerase/isomerase [Clostridia bacterium]